MEYISLSDNFYSEQLCFSFEDLDQPLLLNNGEDPYKLMEELYSTVPPSWLQEAEALLFNKDPDVIAVGDLSMPDLEPSVSPEPYVHSIDVDVGYPPTPEVPELAGSPEPFYYSSNVEVGYWGYASTPDPESPAISPEPIDYNMNQWQYYSADLEPASYVVPEYYADPSMIYHDSSYIGYSALPSYSTEWELDASNSLNDSLINHMELGMTNFDILSNNVMRRSQELEFPPAFGSDQHVVGNMSGYPISEVPLYPSVFDESIPDLSPISTTFWSSSCPIIPEALPYFSPVETTSSQSFPTTPEALQHSFPSATTSPSPSFPVTPDVLPHPSPVATSPSSPIATAEPHPPHRQPTKKRGRKPKKDVNAPPTQQKPRRKLPNGRPPFKSQAWLDRCFVNGICQICGGGSSRNRLDRVLEHLVSTHFFQTVKNVECFEAPQPTVPIPGVEVRRHFIGTPEQFEYTQKYINSIRCSFCPPNASLICRGKNMTEHLTERHGGVEKARLEEETKRLEALMSISKKKKFYSILDQFLYGFPGGASSKLW